ncbi:helix-turn-helix transcriptional regulator [Devosia crocina]|uniref:helix-turn-helix transcriptional regulator n=1 Tax=Devosia crocina TaxID=429728 RepID=UPI001AEC8453|nr:MarR family transcriptional regulator [Devosia crocina]
MALKMQPGMTAAGLGGKLGISGEAARQQLLRLAQEGLVEAQSISQGVGRPSQAWRLTEAGQARFPDTHAGLTLQLLDLIRQNLGDEALDAIIAAREAVTRKNYEAAVAEREGMRDRVAALADLRSAEGYMAGWHEEPDGSLLLVENHCPICAAAAACQGFCRAELDVFRAVLGPDAKVEREDHIIGGGRRCSYRITEAQST